MFSLPPLFLLPCVALPGAGRSLLWNTCTADIHLLIHSTSHSIRPQLTSPVVATSSVHQCGNLSRLLWLCVFCLVIVIYPVLPWPQNQLGTFRLFDSICSGLTLPGRLDPHCLPPPPQLQLWTINLFYYHLPAVFVFCILGLLKKQILTHSCHVSRIVQVLFYTV